MFLRDHPSAQMDSSDHSLNVSFLTSRPQIPTTPRHNIYSRTAKSNANADLQKSQPTQTTNQ